MRLTMLRPVLVVAATALACSSPGEPATAIPVVLDLRVQDSSGAPVPGSFAAFQVWPAPTPQVIDLPPLSRTDSTGRWILPLGNFPEARWDSLVVHVYPRGCDSPGVTTVLRRAAVSQGAPDTIPLTVVTVARAAASAHSAQGQACGFSVSTSFDPRYPDVTLGLRIDSIPGGILMGRWRVDYNWTQGTDYGTFTGSQTGGTLTLALTHAAPWGSCTGFTLAATVASNGTWGPLLSTAPQGCTLDPLRFDMVPSTSITFWP